MIELNLDKEKTYLLACSFGPDSMALFQMLLDNNYRFEVAHVNYNLRDESKTETLNLSNFCREKFIKLHVLEINNWENKSNLEAKCRYIRYNFFSEVCKDNNIENVLVAHNEDDLIETYILQKQRNSFVKFYGLNTSTIINGVNVQRPLLKVKKIDLQIYCDKNNVPYAIDKTNLESSFARNKIRHSIVEKLDNVERQEYIKKINEENLELNNLFYKISTVDLSLCKSFDGFSEKELCYALNAISSKPLSKKTCLEIKKVLRSKKPNVKVPVRSNYFFFKEYGECFFAKDSDFNYEIRLKSPKIVENNFFFFDGTSDTTNRNIKNSDYPLVIRTYRKNDHYKIKDYSCSVNRLFIDWKMPLSMRQYWPIFVNKNDEIIYIPRFKKDFVITSKSNLFVKRLIR